MLLIFICFFLQHRLYLIFLFFFFFNDPAPPEIYPLPLHAALPICAAWEKLSSSATATKYRKCRSSIAPIRSEEHTSELQSQSNLVCRLLLEKKKKKK